MTLSYRACDHFPDFLHRQVTRPRGTLQICRSTWLSVLLHSFRGFPNIPRYWILDTFQQWMMAQREGHTPWLEFYPFQDQVIAGYDQSDPNGVLLVDMGVVWAKRFLKFGDSTRTCLDAWCSRICQGRLRKCLKALRWKQCRMISSHLSLFSVRLLSVLNIIRVAESMR
ncbi:hypothetical protein BU23DRAFT_2262 [Bimuria novae-zelandiae CBS 107.79]|uniref:Uncharacterized protein n=1 Tax=Bimuria novae-zelandiae CBS 107.79 TaxID=1447943 RepID=A0A6A5VT60_9PLEO|nr:hypothetical protein BU23DRAFT_2262 [Bimuria novae-zelandiae CBS 107.79]